MITRTLRGDKPEFGYIALAQNRKFRFIPLYNEIMLRFLRTAQRASVINIMIGFYDNEMGKKSALRLLININMIIWELLNGF